ncbi:MAG: TIGR03943 family protein [Nostocaceae cyanobacterium]|nr:TIGR03943 family protein [Nostocaceae cyanobacterium]
MKPIPKLKSKIKHLLLPWLDVIAITAWGVLMLKYWATGKLNLLIHPNYFGLVVVAGIALIFIGLAKAKQQWRQRRRRVQVEQNPQHVNLFPPGWGSALLLTAAILGFMITPQVFASQKAIQRGVSDLLGTTRIQPQAFRASVRPEERTLIDWVRTLNVYPEPDSYAGQKAKVQGFVIYPEDLSNEYLFLARFVLTCCAADAYPIGLPVKLTESRQQYPPDTWLEIEGEMTTKELSGKRQLTIVAQSVKKIPQPKNPYSY